MSIAVALVRAWPHRHETLQLRLPAGSTVDQALASAGWGRDDGHPGTAIFGVRVEGSQVLADGDRIELLRPLAMDPMQARRLRARRGRG